VTAGVTAMPGPDLLRVLRNVVLRGRDPLGNLERTHAAWGDAVTFRIAGDHLVLLAHPDDIEAVLVGGRDALAKDRVTRSLSQVMGEGLLTADGETWKRHRRLIAPSFAPKQVAAYGEVMVASARARLPPPGEVEIHQVMSALALDIVVRTLFGSEPIPAVGQVHPAIERLMRAFETENRSLWRFVPDRVPAPHRRAAAARAAELRAVLGSVVAHRRAGAPGPDLLWRMLDARDEAGGLSDAELMDEAVTVFLAGHETTAIVLSFALWLLAGHPAAQGRARAEVAALGRDPGTADVAALPFVGAVVKETMRLYPPAWAIAREVRAPLSVGPFRLPVGAQVILSPWVVHRDPRWWADPLAFRPERFLGADPPHRFAWFPFGGGPRVCIGNHFALLEATLVLATVLRAREVRRVDEAAPELLPAVTLRPRRGIRLRVSRAPDPAATGQGQAPRA
jgi:cytochrome P450